MSDRLATARRLISDLKDFLDEAEMRDPFDDVKVDDFLARTEKWLAVSDEPHRTTEVKPC